MQQAGLGTRMFRTSHRTVQAVAVALPWCVLLALLGCAGTREPQGFRIEGTAVPWIDKAATVSALLLGPDNVVATGPISASGAFSLVLPATLDAGVLGAFGPCAAVTVDPPGVRGAGVLFLRVSDGDDELGYIAHTTMNALLEQAAVGDAYSYRIYLDRAATVSGTCVEDTGFDITTVTEEYDLDLSRGWNVVTVALTALTEGARTLEYRRGAPSTLPWRFFGAVQPPPPSGTRAIGSSPSLVNRSTSTTRPL